MIRTIDSVRERNHSCETKLVSCGLTIFFISKVPSMFCSHAPAGSVITDSSPHPMEFFPKGHHRTIIIYCRGRVHEVTQSAIFLHILSHLHTGSVFKEELANRVIRGKTHPSRQLGSPRSLPRCSGKRLASWSCSTSCHEHEGFRSTYIAFPCNPWIAAIARLAVLRISHSRFEPSQLQIQIHRCDSKAGPVSVGCETVLASSVIGIS